MSFIVRSDLPFIGYTAAVLALRAFPTSLRLRWSEPVSKRLGTFWYRLDQSSASIARRNMRTLLGDRLSVDQIEAEVLRHFQVTARGKIFNDILSDLTLGDIKQILPMEGESYLKDALAERRGVLLLGAHFGIHGYMPITLLNRLDYPFVAVIGAEYTGEDSWVYRKIVYPIRSRHWDKLPIINPDGNPQREMVTKLQQKQALVIMPDFINDELFLIPEPHVLSVPFLGRTMPFRTGAFRLARWMKLPVIPYFVVPRNDGFAMKTTPPLPISEEGSIQGLRVDVAAYANRYESYILRDPGLWWQWRQERLLELMAIGDTGSS